MAKNPVTGAESNGEKKARKPRSPQKPRSVFVVTKGNKEDIVCVTNSAEEAMDVMANSPDRVQFVKSTMKSTRAGAAAPAASA